MATNNVLNSPEPFALSIGGTNANLTASNGGIIYSTASAMAVLAGTATAHQALLSGTSTTPAWSTATYPPTTTINQLLYSSAANTITGLATVTTAVLTTSAGVPTWANELSLALGGTNANLTASNGGIFYSSASAGAILAGTATAKQVLLSGASTTPAWSTATYPSTTTINQLLYSSSANTIVGLATSAAAVLTTVSSVPTWASSLSVALGGTGNTSATAYMPICGGTTTTGAFQSVSTAGASAGYVLTFVSTSALPTWQAAGGGGPWTVGTGTDSALGGDGTSLAGGNYSLSYGNTNTSSAGTNSFAFGTGSVTAKGGTAANGAYSLAFGDASLTAKGASATYSFAFGAACSTGNNIVADYSFAFGNGSWTNAQYSFSFGNNCLTGEELTPHDADYSFAFGNSCNTASVAQAQYSFAFGNGCLTGNSSSGNYSLAFGHTCETSGDFSVAIGYEAATNNAGSVVWGDSNISPVQDSSPNQFVLTFAGGYFLNNSSLDIATAGKGLKVAEGSNAKQGVVTLSSGVGVVSNTSVTANSRIFYCAQDTNTIGFLKITARTTSSGFTITSSVLTDSGVVAYEIFEPG